MSENMNDGTVRATARRRLIRGAFAAPAVLTLYSGSVLAATSSKCDIKGEAPGTPPVSDGDDRYLRYRLRQSSADSVITYWIEGSDLTMMVGSGFIPSSTYRQAFNISTNTTVADPILAVSPQPELSNKYAILRVNSNGTVVGVGDGMDGTEVSDTCGSSLTGAVVFKTTG